MNVIGQKFGRLTVIAQSSRKGYSVCKCDCGNIHEVRTNTITRQTNPVLSCGCYRREVSSMTGRNTIHRNVAIRNARNAKYGTNCGIISNPNPPRNNKSGHKGVWYDPVHGTYQAYITLHHKKYGLGTFKNLHDAVKAREEAEEKMFAPIIEAMKTENV